MGNENLRNITNSFRDVRLISLASWRAASEIMPRDRGGPYVVLQDGFDPEDLTITADEFVLGRSGKWLSLSYFYQMSVPERRAEYVFGTAAEIMKIMNDLPPKVQLLRPGDKEKSAPAPEGDEMAAAFRAAKAQAGNSQGKA
jgi:hypothetical protein